MTAFTGTLWLFVIWVSPYFHELLALRAEFTYCPLLQVQPNTEQEGPFAGHVTPGNNIITIIRRINYTSHTAVQGSEIERLHG